MVEKIEAWRDQNGELHQSEEAALLSDARIELLSLFSNPGIVTDIINNRGRVYDALNPLLEYEEEKRNIEEARNSNSV